MRDMERHYLNWHPAHLGWEDLKGHATEPGAVVFADERVGWLRLRSRFTIEDVVPERRMAYRLGFPFNVVHAGGSFEIAPTPDGGCDFEAQIHFGARSRWGGRVLDPLLRKVAPIAALERHLGEEGRNFERLAIDHPVPTGPALSASGTVTAHVRLFIARDPADVFSYFADLRNEPLYNPQVHDVLQTSPGPIGLNTRFTGIHRGIGPVTWRLAEYDPPRHVVIDGSVGRGRYRWIGDLEAAPHGTVFDGRMQWEPPRWMRPFRRLLELLLGWSARRSFRRFASALSRRAEPTAAGSPHMPGRLR